MSPDRTHSYIVSLDAGMSVAARLSADTTMFLCHKNILHVLQMFTSVWFSISIRYILKLPPISCVFYRYPSFRIHGLAFDGLSTNEGTWQIWFNSSHGVFGSQDIITTKQNKRCEYFDDLVQEIRNSIADALELRYSCTNSSMYKIYCRQVEKTACDLWLWYVNINRYLIHHWRCMSKLIDNWTICSTACSHDQFLCNYLSHVFIVA